jgi:hypothetical protein
MHTHWLTTKSKCSKRQPKMQADLHPNILCTYFQLQTTVKPVYSDHARSLVSLVGMDRYIQVNYIGKTQGGRREQVVASTGGRYMQVVAKAGLTVLTKLHSNAYQLPISSYENRNNNVLTNYHVSSYAKKNHNIYKIKNAANVRPEKRRGW